MRSFNAATEDLYVFVGLLLEVIARMKQKE